MVNGYGGLWVGSVSPLLVVAGMVGGCEEEEVAPAPAPVASRAPLAGPRAVATPAAFDLVGVPGGAVLLWSSPATDGGGVTLSMLDPVGTVRGDERSLFSRPATDAAPVAADAVEIAAASGGGRLAVAWVARIQPELRVLATHGPASAEAFAPVEDLGELRVDTVGHRGMVAAAAGEDGNVAVMHRGMPGPCPPGEGAAGEDVGCVRFALLRLGDVAADSRRGLPLAAPAPCERAIAGYLSSGGVWYYGLCTDADRRPTTTVYAIQFDPQYAHAEPVLAGCEPRGMAPSANGVLVTGHCDGSLTAVKLEEAARRRSEIRSVQASVACVDGRPRFTLTGEDGVMTHAVTGPASRLEAWLPEEVAPPGARAVWTGDALLIAHPVGREVSLRRYECAGDELARTDQP